MEMKEFVSLNKGDNVLIISKPIGADEHDLYGEVEPFWGYNPRMKWGKVITLETAPRDNSDTDKHKQFKHDNLWYSFGSVDKVVTKEINPEYFL